MANYQWINILLVVLSSILSTCLSQNIDDCQTTEKPWYKISGGLCCPCEECPQPCVKGIFEDCNSQCMQFYSTPSLDATPRLCSTTCSAHCRPLAEVLRGDHDDLIDASCGLPPKLKIATTTATTTTIPVRKNTTLSQPPTTPATNGGGFDTASWIAIAVVAILLILLVVLFFFCCQKRLPKSVFKAWKGRDEDGRRKVVGAEESRSGQSQSPMTSVSSHSRQDDGMVQAPPNASQAQATPSGFSPSPGVRNRGDGATDIHYNQAPATQGQAQAPVNMSVAGNARIGGNVIMGSGSQVVHVHNYPPQGFVPPAPLEPTHFESSMRSNFPVGHFSTSDYGSDASVKPQPPTQREEATGSDDVKTMPNFPMRTVSEHSSYPGNSSFTKEFDARSSESIRRPGLRHKLLNDGDDMFAKSVIESTSTSENRPFLRTPTEESNQTQETEIHYSVPVTHDESLSSEIEMQTQNPTHPSTRQ